MTSKQYRVALWGVGNVGREALIGIQSHPSLVLVAAHTFSDHKKGRDVGELCGLDPVGIPVTTDIDDICRSDADCVVYVPRYPSLDEVCALLRAGKNVVSSPFLFYAEGLPDAEKQLLREACTQGNSSVLGSGLNPGFVGMVLPLAMAGMSQSIRRIDIVEQADWQMWDNPDITFEKMRFGQPPEQVTLDAAPYLRLQVQLFKEQLYLLAAALKAPLDEVVVEHEVAVAEGNLETIAGTIEQGTVYAQSFKWSAFHAGREILRAHNLWRVGGSLPMHWPQGYAPGWTVTIEGVPSLRAHFHAAGSFERADVTLEEHIRSSSVCTAMQCVNAIPSLCDAPPGIRGSFELPLIFTAAGFS